MKLRRFSRRAWFGALAASLLVIAGCGGSSSQHSSSAAAGTSGTALSQALHEVSDSSYARAYLEWSQVHDVCALGPRWIAVCGIGAGELGPAAQQLVGSTKINPLTARQAIFIGMPPDTAVRLDGGAFTASAISAAMRKLGAQSIDAGGVQFLAMGAEHSVNVDSPLAQFGVINQLDRVVVTGHTVAAGPAQAPVLAVLRFSAGGSLGAAPEYKAIASCLGDVVVAVIARGAPFGAPAGQLVAIGDRRPASGTSPVTEVLCTAGGGAAQADREVAALRRTLGASALLPGTQVPVGSDVASVASARADSDGVVGARAVVALRPSQPAGLLYHVLVHQSVGALLR